MHIRKQTTAKYFDRATGEEITLDIILTQNNLDPTNYITTKTKNIYEMLKTIITSDQMIIDETISISQESKSIPL